VKVGVIDMIEPTLDNVFKKIVEESYKYTNSKDSVLILNLDNNRRLLYNGYMSHLPNEIQNAEHGTFCHKIFNTNQCIHINNIEQSIDDCINKKIYKDIGINSIIGMPINYNNKVIGVFMLLGDEGYNEIDLGLIRILSRSIEATVKDHYKNLN
jgi:transcriptional regulator with GAF, ATPase, and Fis domain